MSLNACTTAPESDLPSLRDDCEADVVDSLGSLAAVRDCRSILGDLTITGVDGELPHLTRVDGALTLGPGEVVLPELVETRVLWVSTETTASLPRLEQVTENLLLASEVSLPSLQRATSMTLRGPAVAPLGNTSEIEQLILQSSDARSFHHGGPVHHLTVDRLPRIEQLELPAASLRSAQVREAPALHTLEAGFAPHVDRLVLDTPSLSTLTGTSALVTVEELLLWRHAFTALDLSHLETARRIGLDAANLTLALPRLTQVGQLELNLEQPALDLRHTQVGSLVLTTTQRDFTLRAGPLNRIDLYSPGQVTLDELTRASYLNLHNAGLVRAHQLQRVDQLALSDGVLELDMPALASIGTLLAERTRSLAPLAGLPSLQDLDHLRLEHTRATRLDGDLSGVRSVILTANADLTDVSALEGAAPESWRTIGNGFTALPALTATQMRVLELSENVTDLTGLESLEALDYLSLVRNPVLTDLDGLSGLRSVNQWLEVSFNPQLCTSTIDAWLANVSNNTGSPATVRDNNDGC